jgi:hypothetical protein
MKKQEMIEIIINLSNELLDFYKETGRDGDQEEMEELIEEMEILKKIKNNENVNIMINCNNSKQT